MSQSDIPAPDPAEPPLTYIIMDPYADRDRLYRQYELFIDGFNV